MQSQPMHRPWEIDALTSSELLKSEQPTGRQTLRSKDQMEAGTLSYDLSRISGGGERDRTDDLLLAKQALSQLSYTPARLVGGSGWVRTIDPRLIKTVL